MMHDMTLSEQLVKRLARYRGEAAPYLEYMLRKDKYSAREAVAEKVQSLTFDEMECAEAFLSLGFFRDLDESMRTAAYCIVFDAEYEKDLRNEIKANTPYSGNEKIFRDKEISELREKDLIQGLVGERIPGSNIFKKGNQWGYYDRRIPVPFYDWLENCFTGKQTRIRIEPGGFYDHRPPQPLLECLTIPSKWKWWKKLTLYTGEFTGSEYILLGDDKTKMDDFWDYNVHHVRKIQVAATRKKEDYISFMIEELSEYCHPTNSDKKYVIGRMIHLDSEAKFGTPFTDAVLKHIDLAFNLYIDDDADVRMGERLSDGKKVQDATYRTHVLRVDDVPFETLFKFANAFFRSHVLTEEWLKNEFV